MLWHCWLGHLTHKIVSEMTYNVSSGTLNTTIHWARHLICPWTIHSEDCRQRWALCTLMMHTDIEWMNEWVSDSPVWNSLPSSSLAAFRRHLFTIFFCHAMLCKCSLCRQVVSVTFANSVKRNKRIFKIFPPSGSQAILVFPYQTAWQYSDGNPPQEGHRMQIG